MPLLTCLPSASLLPVPAGAMGGCFSKPKPGDCHPAVSVGRSRSAQRTLAGGMLILSSCGEDYGPINPPQIPRCSRSQAGSCAGAAAVLGAGGELSRHPATPSKHPLPALPHPISSYPHHPPRSCLLAAPEGRTAPLVPQGGFV